MKTFNGKLAVVQRVLPAYRMPFFEALAQRCAGGLTLFAGDPLPVEGIRTAENFKGAAFTRIENHHFFHPRHPLYICRQPNAGLHIAAARPDALIVEANPRYPDTPGAVRMIHQAGKPVLGWGLGAPPLHGPLGALRSIARRKLIASLDGMIAYSRRGADEYAQLGVLTPDRIFTAHNAVSPPPDTRPPGRGPLAHPRSVLFVGRLQARKRVDLLLQACSSLPETLRPKLTIVGDGPARTELEALAATLFPDAVFTGELSGKALAAQFAAADLFVLPGTGGLAVQEAMSHALPVLVAEGDGTQEDLVRPANGWLVPPGDLRALHQALLEAVQDRDLRQKGLESRRIVAEEINIFRMADQFVSAVNRAAEAA